MYKEAPMTAPHDEQTEIDELDEIVLKPAQWQYDDYLKAKAALETWSRQQTARVLDGLMKKSSKTDMVLREGKWVPYFTVPVETIAALRVGLEGRK